MVILEMEDNKKYYLKESVYAEPLINNWYAWSYLLSPITYSLYLKNTHRRLLNSFLNNAELHILANTNKAMSGGGEFVNCTREDYNAIKAHYDRLAEEYGDLIEVADDIKKLDQMLLAHQSGESLEPLYGDIPPSLKGFVELLMDRQHRPDYRIIESLVYSSPLYKESIQSMCFGINEGDKERAFVFSTPRINYTQRLKINQPFNSQFWDKLFRLRTSPLLGSEIKVLFSGVDTEGLLSFESLFTEYEPAQPNPKQIKSARITYVGHAGLLIESKQSNVLIDPMIGVPNELNRDDMISYSQLPEKIDYVLLTHNHSDHVHFETLLQLRSRIGKVVVPKNNGGGLLDPSLKLMLSRIGFDVVEVDDLEEIVIPDGKILSIPFLGEHGDLNIRSKAGWFIEINDKKIYAGADSSNLSPEMFMYVKKLIGELDVLAIGMECVGAPFTWAYGALFTDKVHKQVKESRRLNGTDSAQALDMVDTFKPKQALVYALGYESYYGYMMGMDYSDDSKQIVESKRFLEQCKEKNVTAKLLTEKYTLDLI